MKRIIIFMLAAVIAFVSSFTALGITIDGKNQGIEWDGATTYKLFSGESNCSVNFGAVKVKFAPEEYAVYLCFMFRDSMLEQGNTLSGISFTVENSPPYVLTMSNSPYAADIDKYDVSGAMYIDENNGGTCEVRVGIKSGVPKELSCSVRFLDHQGVPSNYNYFTLINEQYTETTKLMIAPTADNSDPVHNPDLITTVSERKTKTSTERSTKVKTTKATTTKKPKQTTTQKAKTTKAAKTEKETQGATVYYYEKEIIISQVIVTQTVPETTAAATSQSHTQTETDTQPQTTTLIPVSSGSKYKAIAGTFCAAAFIAVAAWSVIGAKKDKKEETQDSEENKE